MVMVKVTDLTLLGESPGASYTITTPLEKILPVLYPLSPILRVWAKFFRGRRETPLKGLVGGDPPKRSLLPKFEHYP